ncbi:hypothetical protein BGX24_009218 [Mortierella sp. AD032]|nr:hypothetical protein BGX24_009218 [Mortierella sp. AD032]
MDRHNNNSSDTNSGKHGSNTSSGSNNSNINSNTLHSNKINTNTERNPETTPRKITPESSRNPSQQTPKTPTSARAKTTPTSRGTTPSSAMFSPYLANMNRGAGDRTSTTNTPKDKSKRDESESTTPAYPDSSTLLNRSTSNARIQLSDIQPVETNIVERIKTLEISIEQHRASHDQLEKFIQTLQQELAAVNGIHKAVVEVADTRMRDLKSDMDQLQEASLANSGRLQELWELVRQLSENLASKESQLIEIQNRINDLKQRREEILQDREDTEREPLEIIRMERAKLQLEYDEIQMIEHSCAEIMEQLKKSFSSEEIEVKQARVMQNDDRIAQLENKITKNKSSSMIDERNADELILMFDKVYERRIRSHSQEFEAIEQQALVLEKQRDQEANAALEEYLRLNQLSVQAEENASREEFNLLAEREQLAELESLLEALKLELNQRRATSTV